MARSKILISLLCVLSLHGLSACTIARPFESTETLDNMAKDETVVVALTHVVLKESINSDIFWERSEEVVESLETHPGFLGYSLRFVVLGDEAWTMTVWEDQKSLQDFVASGVHGKAMLQGIGSVDGGGFHNFESKVGDVPPSWEVAETLLKQEGRSYGY